jgi:hypothetical protein
MSDGDCPAGSHCVVGTGVCVKFLTPLDDGGAPPADLARGDGAASDAAISDGATSDATSSDGAIADGATAD